MIQSKPRASDVAMGVRKIAENRSRTKKGHLLSTQPKKDSDLNSSESRTVMENPTNPSRFGHFNDQESNQGSTMKNHIISKKIQGVQMVRSNAKNTHDQTLEKGVDGDSVEP